MNQFSCYNYDNLPKSSKDVFNKALAKGLSSLLSDVKSDDVLCKYAFEEFVSSEGAISNTNSFVPNVYYCISGGIQAGSGNQILYQSVLSVFTESWKLASKFI